IGGATKPEDPHDDEQCPFCAAPRRTDEESLIVHRGESAYVILNLYPYNSGHLLVCPYRHVSDYTDLDEAEVLEVAELTRTAMRVVREVSAPAGFSLCMNQGEVAGAGMAAHLHQHVVTRWPGYATFVRVVGRTKRVPILLAATRRLYADAWPWATMTEAGRAEPRRGGPGTGRTDRGRGRSVSGQNEREPAPPRPARRRQRP